MNDVATVARGVTRLTHEITIDLGETPESRPGVRMLIGKRVHTVLQNIPQRSTGTVRFCLLSLEAFGYPNLIRSEFPDNRTLSRLRFSEEAMIQWPDESLILPLFRHQKFGDDARLFWYFPAHDLADPTPQHIFRFRRVPGVRHLQVEPEGQVDDFVWPSSRLLVFQLVENKKD
jgi:hypothetical protein